MYKKLFKRFIDFVISLIAMPFVLVAICIFAPIIYFTDRGPIFYNAQRLGKNGVPFKMFKLRTMYVNSPDIRNEDGSTYNGDDDPRVTSIGRFMRKTSIDELPQFINVLIGQMSIIGPRPDPLDDMEIYTEYQRKKLLVVPGITGYNQAYFRNAINQDDKFNNDVYYVEYLSFSMDVKVFFKTISSVLGRQNIYNDVANEEKENRITVGRD